MSEYGEIIIYQTDDGVTKLEVNMQNDTVWLSLDQMSELFQRDKSTISRHIKNVFTEGELLREATVANFATVQIEGDRQVNLSIEYYNLDVIISVGYRVKSHRGTQFRIWANSVLKEYIIKGFVMDDERLKGNAGGNYWKELLERIRDNRVSHDEAMKKAKTEYRKYQEITLSPVEEEYLKSIKGIEKEAKNRKKS